MPRETSPSPRKAKKTRRRATTKFSLRGLANALGKKHPSVRRWIRHADWKFGPGPWPKDQLPEIQFWADDHLRKNPGEGQFASESKASRKERRAKLQVLIERAAKLRLDRELMGGIYIRRSEVEASRVARVQVVRRELSNIRLLATKMQGMNLIKMEELLENWARGVCQKFASGEDEEPVEKKTVGDN